MAKRLVSVILSALALGATASEAAPLTYQFSAAVTVELRGLEDFSGLASVDDPADRLFAAGTSISGRFTYDPSATGSPSGTGTVFPALSAFSGEAGGNAFSSPGGVVVIQDDGADLDPTAGQDLRDLFLLLAGDQAPGFAGFTLNNGTSDFALNGITLFFIEGTVPYVPFASGLPASLPPPDPETVRVRLGFDDLDNPGTIQLVFAEPVSLTAVPVPPAAILLATGLALLGRLRRAAAG